MGAWGYEVFENDTACDWLCGWEKFIRDGIQSDDADESLAAIAMFISSTFFIPKDSICYLELLTLAGDRMDEILGDEKWFKQWDSSVDKRQAVERLNEQLSKATKDFVDSQ